MVESADNIEKTELFTDFEISDLIRDAVGETGDISAKLKYAYRYKDTLTVATLIYYAKANGYELPETISGA